MSDKASTAANLEAVAIRTGDLIEELSLRGHKIVHPRAEDEFIVHPTEHRWLGVVKMPICVVFIVFSDQT